MIKLTQEYLKECVDYDPETGVFKWKERPKHHFEKELSYHSFNANLAGKEIHTVVSGGYMSIKIHGKMYGAHRVAFLFMEGYMPENHVDHIDRDKSNNRWGNLREVSRNCNSQNCNISKNNKSGVTGVCWNRADKKWKAYIMVYGKYIHLGSFDNIYEAAKARLSEEIRNEKWSCSVHSSAKKYIEDIERPNTNYNMGVVY